MKTKYKIVVVENDEDEQAFIGESLNAAEQFELLALAKNGNVLMEWLEQNPTNLPDVILSDLNMPGKNGYDILTEIKNNTAYAHIPVIISSTSSTTSTIAKCMQLGATDFVVKPDTFVNYGPFLQNVYSILQQREEQQVS